MRYQAVLMTAVLKFCFMYFKSLYKLTTVYSVLTCKIKLSNLSFTTRYTYYTFISLTLGSSPSPWVESLHLTTYLHRMTIKNLIIHIASSHQLVMNLTHSGFKSWANCTNNVTQNLGSTDMLYP